MEKVLTFKPQNTCSSEIKVKVENDILLSVEFTGGCNGNLQGISQLVSGMAIEDVLCRLEGIRCGHKTTSCPDQLCKAIRLLKDQ